MRESTIFSLPETCQMVVNLRIMNHVLPRQILSNITIGTQKTEQAVTLHHLFQSVETG